jgi:RND family efflux transporter MFP subunit
MKKWGGGLGFSGMLLAMLALALLGGCREKPQEVVTEELRPVRFMELAPDTGVRVRTFTGLTRSGMASRMSFRVPGTLQKLHVRVGDTVENDRLIAELETGDYQLRLQEAEAALSRAQAEARNAEAVYGRVQALYERRNASRNELDTARAAFESSQAAVRSIENRLELARRQLEYTRLVAPDRCAVAAIPVEENENVAAGQAVVLVNCGARVDVRIGVPATHISGVREGMAVRVRVDALGNGDFEGMVSEVGVASVGLETTFPVTVRLKAPDERILPGMAAEVDIPMERETAGVLRVPFRSVGEDGEGRFVFCLEELDGKKTVVRRRSVKVGAVTAEGLEILSGLEAGDRVVTAGIAHISDGLAVRLWREAQP